LPHGHPLSTLLAASSVFSFHSFDRILRFPSTEIWYSLPRYYQAAHHRSSARTLFVLSATLISTSLPFPSRSSLRSPNRLVSVNMGQANETDNMEMRETSKDSELSVDRISEEPKTAGYSEKNVATAYPAAPQSEGPSLRVCTKICSSLFRRR
jgi:hypothetical protein